MAERSLALVVGANRGIGLGVALQVGNRAGLQQNDSLRLGEPAASPAGSVISVI